MFDIIQFCQDYNIQYWDQGKNVSPGWVNVSCIWCGDDSNHLGWNIYGSYFNCWKCGVHRLEATVQKILKITYQKALDIVWEYSKEVQHSQYVHAPKASATSISLPGTSLTKFHRKYLSNRKFDPDQIIRDYGVTGTGPKEEWQGHLYELRIIIPIYFHQKLISFQGRDFTDKQKERYKGCPLEKSVMNYKHVLYNWDNATSSRVVVVEGIVDVWRLGSGFVASFGTSMTSSQIHLLSSKEEVLFLFDPEPAAHKKAVEYASQLASMGIRTEVVELDGDQDPGDLTTAQAAEVRKELLGG